MYVGYKESITVDGGGGGGYRKHDVRVSNGRWWQTEGKFDRFLKNYYHHGLYYYGK